MKVQDRRIAPTSSSKWKHWALALGLLACTSDIRPADGTEPARNPQGPMLAGWALAPGNIFTARDHEIRMPDLSKIAHSPPEEIEHLPYGRIIREAAGRYDLDPDLIAAVIMTESRFNPSAVSKKGAKGLMQIMPVTAEALDLKDIYSPEENIKAGTRHLSWLLSKVDGDLRLALAAYNAGLQKVRTYQGIPPYGETEEYVAKVMRHYRTIKRDSISNHANPHGPGING